MATQAMESCLVGAMQTVAVNGAHNASRALSKWLRRGVRLTCEGFQSVPMNRATSVVGASDDVIAAIHLPLSGDVTGHMLLTFPEEVALTLADIMMQVPEGTATTLGEIEQSCLEETGNIVCSAYANSLSKWLRLHIEPSVPVFAHDLASAIIDPLLADFAAHRDEVYVAVTDFLLDKLQLEWGLLLLPSESSLELMEKRSRTDDVRRTALQTIAVNGAFHASRAMSKWLKRGVKISTEGFTRVALNDVAKAFDPSKAFVALHLPLTEQLHGHALLGLSEEHALRVCDLLMEQPVGTATRFDEVERSCLEETGNIIASSFVNSWSMWLDVHVETASPQFVFDLPQAVIDGVLPEQALNSDEVLMARTHFVVEDQWLEWVFLLLPSPSTMRLIESSCE